MITPLDIEKLFAEAESACRYKCAQHELATIRHKAFSRIPDATRSAQRATTWREMAELCNKLRYETVNEKLIAVLKELQLAEISNESDKEFDE